MRENIKSLLAVTVRLAEGLQRRERMIQKRTRRKTAREMRGNASIRTGSQEDNTKKEEHETQVYHKVLSLLANVT